MSIESLLRRMSSFALGNECSDYSRKAIRGLVANAERESGPSHHEGIFLVLDTAKALVKQDDYIPRIIPLSKGLDRIEDKSVLLVLKDPSTPYREELTKKNSPTEDMFNQIYTLSKLKNLAKHPKKLLKLFKEFDMIMADIRLQKLLPEILGASFFARKKKVPFVIQMAPPDKTAPLTPGKKSPKLKDERCDAKYVSRQAKSIAKNTFFIPSSHGTCISIKVAYSDWTEEEILNNCNDVLKFLLDPKYLPVGGLLRTKKHLQSAHLKTSESAALPIFKSIK